MSDIRRKKNKKSIHGYMHSTKPLARVSPEKVITFHTCKVLTAAALIRDHPATEVYVTGTFDDWAKSVKLQSKGGYFEKLVDLPVADKKIYYKVCDYRTLLSKATFGEVQPETPKSQAISLKFPKIAISNHNYWIRLYPYIP